MSIELIDTIEGADATLAWHPVDGVTLYRLVILDSDGHPCGAWSGAATSLPLHRSGVDPVNDDIAAMTWQVSGYDATGVPIAFSDPGSFT